MEGEYLLNREVPRAIYLVQARSPGKGGTFYLRRATFRVARQLLHRTLYAMRPIHLFQDMLFWRKSLVDAQRCSKSDVPLQ